MSLKLLGQDSTKKVMMAAIVIIPLPLPLSGLVENDIKASVFMLILLSSEETTSLKSHLPYTQKTPEDSSF